jgi:hypothetical protein
VVQLTIQDGPVHIHETTEAAPALSEALVNFLHISPRSSGGGGGSSGGGSSTVMYADSAIRGCSGYIEWSPIYQPSADACRNYCVVNGASACEWYVDGSCYVEFGSGCRVESGFSGWSAALIGTAPPPPPPPPSGYVGCFTDSEERALPVWFGEGHTIESCVDTATQNGYAYAGLQYYGHCFAGNGLGYSQVSDGECNTLCNANGSETCGGAWRNSIFTAASTPAPPSPSAGPTYVGCFTDTDERALPAWLGEGHTVESCTAAAQQEGYVYAGLQYYGHCFAGNSIGYSQVSDGECNTACNANSSEFCGGAWRNSIYAVRP